MKNIFSISGLAIVTFMGLSASTARADMSPGGLYIEPGVVYDYGKGKINISNPVTGASEINGDERGLGATLRVGAHLGEILFLGGEGLYLHPQFTDGSFKPEADNYAFGLMAGAQMPIAGLRVWASYLPYGVMDVRESYGIDTKFTRGEGIKLGAGIHVLMVSINLEYLDMDYSGAQIQSNPPISTSGVKYQQRSWLVGVSFPITL